MTQLFDIRLNSDRRYYEICYTIVGGEPFWQPAASFWITKRIPFAQQNCIETLEDLLIMEGWEPPQTDK